jgi:L1 cell adhesion molecule like protein
MSSQTSPQSSEITDIPIGIDLGTTYSCVGAYRNGQVDIFANDMGNRTTPSVVAFTEHERLIGDSAKNQATMNVINTIYDVKRLIGRKFSDPIVQNDIKLWPFKVIQGPNDKPLVEVKIGQETKQFSAEEISAMVLTKMKETAEAALGQKVIRAVITVPAYFNDSQRQATKDAAIIAGLTPMRILNEPTAGALCYGLDKDKEKEHNVLIFDLGGGTFDVSLLCVSLGVFEVKATGGDTHLGGEDFDNDLVNYCIKDIQKKHKKDISKIPRAIRRLKTACEKAKRALSSGHQTTVEVDALFDGVDYNTVLTRARFEEICGHWFQKTLEPVRKVLEDSKISKSQIDEIVLVGGSTRIPKVQELLKEFFGGKVLCKSVNVDEAVAYGAAVQAAIMNGGSNADKKIDGLILLDVCPLTLGVKTSGNIMTPIVPRGTPIPTKKTQQFSTYVDNQSTVCVEVYEGERQFTKDNNLLGTFDLHNIPPMPRGVPKIDITYELDTNGILTVSAVESSTNNKKTITIKNEKGRMSKEEIEEKIKEASQYEEQDKVWKEKIMAKQGLESFLYSARNSAQEGKDKVGPNVSKIESLVKEGLEWLDNHQNESTQTYSEKQKELEQLIRPLFTVSGSDTNDEQHEPMYNASSPFGKNSSPGPKVDVLD